MQPAINASGAITKEEVETRRSKTGSEYDVLILTLSTGDKVELNSFSPLDKGTLTLIKVLAKGTVKTASS